MNSRHHQFYKSRGSFRKRGGNIVVHEGLDFFGIPESSNAFDTLSDGSSRRRFQRGNASGAKSRPFRGDIKIASYSRRYDQTRGIIEPRNAAPWNKISILNGKSISREALLQNLGSHVDGRFTPVLYKILENGDVQFLIENDDVAQAIKSASRRIVAPTGQRLIINVAKCNAPVIPLQPGQVEVLKKVLENRFDISNDFLNLHDFGEDPVIHQNGAYLSLSRHNVMMAVVNLIDEVCINHHIDLKSIDISKNRLRYLDFFSTLTLRCPHVKKLILADNQIENITELEKLSAWAETLIELNVDKNPMCGKIRNPAAYTTAIRRIFPKLLKLDDKTLPPAYKSGIEEELQAGSSFPPIKSHFFVNNEFKALCSKFVEEFFTIFDNFNREKRKDLFRAYDEDAVFTMTAVNLTEESNRCRSSDWREFLRDSHNIKCMGMWEHHRSKLIRKGQLSILTYFCNEFPAVKHDLTSFVVDISFATDSLICLNVSGLYELKNADSVGGIRFVTHVFLLIPKNEGLAIVNQQMFSSTVSREQAEAYKIIYSATDDSSTKSENHVMLQKLTVGEQPINDKHKMIAEFSAKSGMKNEWSEKCLEDCNWNFDQAAFTFSELNKKGAIPPEAFAK